MGVVVDHEFLFDAAGCEVLGAGLRGEGDGADDVRVLESVETFACVGVPDFAVEDHMLALFIVEIQEG